MAVYYRAVSLAELADIRPTGQLRSSPGSCEGKHMATTFTHAQRWGEALYSGNQFAIIRIDVADVSATHFWQWDELDGIGPACFATIAQLTGAQVVIYES